MVNGSDEKILSSIRRNIRSGRYRVRLHAVRHMIEEGFDEMQLKAVILGRSRILENYAEDQRCLVVGKLTRDRFLHVVCDYSKSDCIDLITAYVPQRPWWETPIRRARKK